MVPIERLVKYALFIASTFTTAEFSLADFLSSFTLQPRTTCEHRIGRAEATGEVLIIPGDSRSASPSLYVSGELVSEALNKGTLLEGEQEDMTRSPL